MAIEHNSPPLHGRHRDKNGEISKKHGNTLIGTLRKMYGRSFASGSGDHEKLADVLHNLDEPSLAKLVHDHDAGQLHTKLREHGSPNDAPPV